MSTSPELTGGTGFIFEHTVAARYLVNLLSESVAYSAEGYIVQRVALQQAPEEPLDDLIVDAIGSSDETIRLSFQVKRTLVISCAKTNTDFREVVINSWKTLKKDSFRQSTDRYGVITASITDKKYRGLTTICEWARNSDVAESFITRFNNDQNGHSSARHQEIKDTIVSLLTETIGSSPSPEDLHEFFRHFLCIRVDLLHEGSTSLAEPINLLTNALHESDRTRSLDLWKALLKISGEGAGNKAIFNRVTLLNLLKGYFRFSPAQSLCNDIKVLNQKADEAIEDISSSILGVEISRKQLLDKVTAGAKQHRFTQIQGLPGAGKSVVLKLLAQDLRNTGSILFLKHDMLSGCSWLEFANSIGLRNTDIKLLLTEISATGTPYLLIDGIDRVGANQRKIITALINKILAAPEFDDWNIIVTARDAGIEPLRTWLPEKLFDKDGASIIDVPAFNDKEAQELSESIPALRDLLFGAERVREIARRPFFTSILAKEISTTGNCNSFTLKSEIDLISKWWSGGGGYSAESNIPQRQQALMNLAESNVYRLGSYIKISGLKEETISLLDTLIKDGVIQNQNQGHTIKFAHDIFFEWAFFHCLIDSENDWIEKITSIGEPPALGHTVQLLSQRSLIDGTWKKHAALLRSNTELRLQWVSVQGTRFLTFKIIPI